MTNERCNCWIKIHYKRLSFQQTETSRAPISLGDDEWLVWHHFARKRIIKGLKSDGTKPGRFDRRGSSIRVIISANKSS